MEYISDQQSNFLARGRLAKTRAFSDLSVGPIHRNTILSVFSLHQKSPGKFGLRIGLHETEIIITHPSF